MTRKRRITRATAASLLTTTSPEVPQPTLPPSGLMTPPSSCIPPGSNASPGARPGGRWPRTTSSHGHQREPLRSQIPSADVLESANGTRITMRLRNLTLLHPPTSFRGVLGAVIKTESQKCLISLCICFFFPWGEGRVGKLMGRPSHFNISERVACNLRVSPKVYREA